MKHEIPNKSSYPELFYKKLTPAQISYCEFRQRTSVLQKTCVRLLLTNAKL